VSLWALDTATKQQGVHKDSSNVSKVEEYYPSREKRRRRPRQGDHRTKLNEETKREPSARDSEHKDRPEE